MEAIKESRDPGQFSPQGIFVQHVPSFDGFGL